MSDYVQVPVLNEDVSSIKESPHRIKGSLQLQEPKIVSRNRYKIYKIRWFMLYLQVMCSTCMAMQFLEFSIIPNIIVDYYGVSYEAVDWTAMLFMLVYLIFVFPVMYICNKLSMRGSLLVTMTGACAAAWIKVGSVSPDRYWAVLLGQVVVSSTQGFVMVLPARFAVAWFGQKQVALACGLGVFGIQLGSAIGCVIPALVVKPSKLKEDVAHDLYILHIGFAVLCTVFLMLTILVFRSTPPTPPSGAQKQLEETIKIELKQSTKQLFSNYSFILLLIATGIGIGIFYTIPALLSQIIAQYYENATEDAGRIGLLMLVIGMLGVTAGGYVLGKFGRYKLTTVSIFVLYLLSMVAFTLALCHSLTAVYITSMILGFFMTATYSVALEVAAQLTYPIPETTSSGYILGAAQAFGIGLIYLYSFFLYKFGAIWANALTCAELLLCTILILCMRFELKRQAAENIHSKEETKEKPSLDVEHYDS